MIRISYYHYLLEYTYDTHGHESTIMVRSSCVDCTGHRQNNTNTIANNPVKMADCEWCMASPYPPTILTEHILENNHDNHRPTHIVYSLDCITDCIQYAEVK